MTQATQMKSVKSLKSVKPVKSVKLAKVVDRAKRVKLLEPASLRWINESNQVGDGEVALRPDFHDPETGVAIIRMTTRPCISTNIYPETPVSSPDGKRFIFRRTESGTHAVSYWVADTETQRIRQITEENRVHGAPIFSPDGKCIYYLAGGSIRRMCPETFGHEEIFRLPAKWKSLHFGSQIAHCGLRFLFSAPNIGQRGHSVVVADLETGKIRVVYESTEGPCGHAQFSHNNDCKIMFQVNDGMEFDSLGNWTKLVGENGASLHIVDLDGSNHVKLRVGSSPVERVQGHQTWVGRSNTVITTLHRRESVSSPWIQDRVVTINADDKSYRIVGEGPGFTHIHTDPEGKYWLADCNRTAKIYVGSIKTGRHRLFCSTGSTFGAPQYTHPHPFFIGDGRAIGWNSDVTGIPHVFFARIPDGFLSELDTE